MPSGECLVTEDCPTGQRCLDPDSGMVQGTCEASCPSRWYRFGGQAHGPDRAASGEEDGHRDEELPEEGELGLDGLARRELRGEERKECG